MMMATIYTLDGGELGAGLQGCNVCDEALQAAQRHADQLGQDVLLQDDDGLWQVHTRRADGAREPADDVTDDTGRDDQRV